MNRRVELALPPDKAWSSLQEAWATIGKVEEAHNSTRSLTGKARYGLNPVRMRISVLSGPAEGTSVLEMQGRGHDVWGVASRKVCDRLIETLGSSS